LSNQGSNGGYSMNKRTDEIYLYNLMSMLDGEIAIADCLAESKDKDCCLEDSCSIKSPITKLQKEIENLFKNKTISDFV